MMSEMRYRRQIRGMAEMAPQPYHQQQFLLAMLESQSPVQTQLAWVLQRDDFDVVDHAIFAATYLAIAALAPAVIDAFERCPHAQMRSWWMMRFGTLEHPQMDHFLMSTLQTSEEAELRTAAVIAMRDGRRAEIVPVLLALAQNTNESIELRGNAIEALAYHGDEDLVPRLLPFLQDDDARLRWDALYTVGHLGNTSYAAFVEPLLTDTYRVHANLPSIAEDAREVLDRWASSIRMGGISWRLTGQR